MFVPFLRFSENRTGAPDFMSARYAPRRVQLSSASDYAPAAYLADPPGDTSQWSSDSLPAPQVIKPSAIAAQVR